VTYGILIAILILALIATLIAVIVQTDRGEPVPGAPVEEAEIDAGAVTATILPPRVSDSSAIDATSATMSSTDPVPQIETPTSPGLAEPEARSAAWGEPQAPADFSPDSPPPIHNPTREQEMEQNDVEQGIAQSAETPD
jgi:hypothetical protein